MHRRLGVSVHMWRCLPCLLGIGSQLPTPLIPGTLASPSLPLPTAASWPQLTSAPVGGLALSAGRVWIGLEPHCISGKSKAMAVPTRGWQFPSAFSRQLVWGL